MPHVPHGPARSCNPVPDQHSFGSPICCDNETRIIPVPLRAGQVEPAIIADMSATNPFNHAPTPLPQGFFDLDVGQLAPRLLGKVIRHFHRGLWLSARIIETEAYRREEKGSHASLGLTHSRRALFMPAGTLYMYYARGGDSLNPAADGRPRETRRLCNGQTLLCRSLHLKVPEWNAQQMQPGRLIVEDDGYRPELVIQTTRLGIPLGRDEHLPYRFVDHAYAPFCTRNPLGRTREEGRDYILHHADAAPWKHC